MGFNFRKSFKIAPGVRLNVGKKGISSVSVGGKGGRVSINKKGVRSTVSAPGTGLSYSKQHNFNNDAQRSTEQNFESSIGFGKLLLIGIGLLFMIIWMFG